MIVSILVFSVLGHCLARPSEDLGGHNEIIVPRNCPTGQEWINGICRDVWRRSGNQDQQIDEVSGDISKLNMITVPPNCPPGQQWINGRCRDIWRTPGVLSSANLVPQNVVTVPPNCPPGQELINGQCRDIWRGGTLAESETLQKLMEIIWAEHMQNSRQVEDVNNSDDTSVSSNADDPLRNIISIPNQCPEGYKPDALGVCRKQL